MNSFHSIKEEILSSKTNTNGTTSVKQTSRRINVLFFLSLIVGGGVVYGFSGGETPLQVCQQTYMQSTNAIQRYNEENPSYPVHLPEYNCNSVISIIGTASGAIVPPPPKKEMGDSEQGQQYPAQGDVLGRLHINICKKQINSPLCKDKELLGRLYRITEERLPNKQFFPILIGMTNAESSLGLDFAKDKVGGTCSGRNNWGGAKYQILDNNTRVYKRNINGFDYKYPRDQYDCNLFPFESIEEYWISKVNGIRYGYKGCIDNAKPIECISYKYVGAPHIAEKSWIANVSTFLE